MRDGRSVGWVDGWTFVRTLVSSSVGGKGDGRADERSIEQIHVAVGRTVRRPTVEHTDRGKGKRSEGRSLGRTGGRSHGLGHDQSQGSGADWTPDRAVGKSKERQEQTPRDVLCVGAKKRCSSLPISGRKPAMPNWWRAFPTSSRLSQRLGKGLGSMVPASVTAKDGESAEKQRR